LQPQKKPHFAKGRGRGEGDPFLPEEGKKRDWSGTDSVEYSTIPRPKRRVEKRKKGRGRVFSTEKRKRKKRKRINALKIVDRMRRRVPRERERKREERGVNPFLKKGEKPRSASGKEKGRQHLLKGDSRE